MLNIKIKNIRSNNENQKTKTFDGYKTNSQIK